MTNYRSARIVAACILAFVAIVGNSDAAETVGMGRIDERLLECVVKITADATPVLHEITGTGFIVSLEPTPPSATRTNYLVTNKHMIGDWNEADRDLVNKYATLRVA